MSTRRTTPTASSTSGLAVVPPSDADQLETSFAEVVGLIEQARQQANDLGERGLYLVGVIWRDYR